MLLKHHIVGFITALLVFWFAFKKQQQKFNDELNRRQDFSILNSNYFSNFGDGIETSLFLNDFITDKNGILLFGSSELGTTYDRSQIPYKFYNQYATLPPLIAFGHAGNQSLAILTEIMTLDNNIRKNRIVILISPSWFERDYSVGTSLQSFLEFNTEFNLYKIYFNDLIEDKFKQYLYDFVKSHISEIIGGSSILNLYSSSTGNDFVKKIEQATFKYFSTIKNKRYLSAKKQYPDSIRKTQIEFLYKKSKNYPINWDSLYKGALDYHKKISTNNNLGINNEYYTKYIEGHDFEMKAVPLSENQELSDYKMLIDFLVSKGNKEALFIITPLHQKIYKNLELLTPTINEVEKYAKNNGFEVYNLWKTNPEDYQLGLLTDRMHVGEVGWHLINKKICNHFKLNEKGN